MTKQEELQMRLQIKLPISYWGRVEKAIELDKEWAERISKTNIDKWDDCVRMTDVLHDINGIIEEDKHFLPRL